MATTTPWDPQNSLVRSWDGISRFFAEPVSPGFYTPTSLTVWTPAVDIFETEGELVLKAELPDIKAKDLDVRVENNTLTLSGERKYDKQFKEENALRMERYYGRFTRTFTFPSAVKLQAIEAEYRNGVLTLRLLKPEEAKPKQSKIAVGSAGVKGVRIGMDGKTPPTTSVVVDLEQACGYELKPGSGNSFVLTLHAQAGAVAKSAPVPAPAKAVTAKAAAPAPAPTPTPKLQTAAAKPVPAAPAAVPAEKKNAAPVAAAAKPHDAPAPKKPATGVAVAVTTKPAAKPAAPAATKIAANEKPAAASKPAEAPKPPKPEEKKWAMSGKRDPFFSPVVQQPTGSGCSTGKKCLEIGQINVRGVVKSDSGYIAVVTNSLNKAYFLRENDPVFNGYVMRITGDTVVFQETVQDKLGKPMTHEVVKRIFTPAV